eukprot:UN08540
MNLDILCEGFRKELTTGAWFEMFVSYFPKWLGCMLRKQWHKDSQECVYLIIRASTKASIFKVFAEHKMVQCDFVQSVLKEVTEVQERIWRLYSDFANENQTLVRDLQMTTAVFELLNTYQKQMKKLRNNGMLT